MRRCRRQAAQHADGHRRHRHERRGLVHRQRGHRDARQRTHLGGFQRAHEVVDAVELVQQRRRVHEPAGRRLAHHAQHVVQRLGHVGVLAQAGRHGRLDEAGVHGVRGRGEQRVSLARAHEGDELHLLGQHAGAALVDAVHALHLFLEERAGHAHIVARLGQLLGHAAQARVHGRHTGAQLLQHGLAGGRRVAVELDAPFHLAHERDDVVRQIRGVGEHGRLVGVAAASRGAGDLRGQAQRHFHHLAQQAAVGDEVGERPGHGLAALHHGHVGEEAVVLQAAHVQALEQAGHDAAVFVGQRVVQAHQRAHRFEARGGGVVARLL
jgi:hypothetical protein